jgi:hypothetical protein
MNSNRRLRPEVGPSFVVRDSTLDSVVTISAAAPGGAGGLAAAAWTSDGSRSTVPRALDDYEEARTLAHRLAEQLSVGIEPR